MPPTLDKAQISHFLAHGWIHLAGALGKNALQPVRVYVLDELKRQNYWAGGRNLSRRLRDLPMFQQIGRLGQAIRYPGLHERLMPPALHALAVRLAGAPLPRVTEAQLLITLPHNADWSLTSLNWHRDVAADPARLPGVQAFVLIDDVLPRGGGTVAVAGSHRLRGRPPALDTLLAGAGEGSVLADGVELSILEMAGRAGDVYLMDMRLLHAPSINATRNVRIMATMRFPVPEPR